MVAKYHADFIKSFLNNNPIKNPNKKIGFFSGGETSVTIKNSKGKGGRNTEYLLSLAIQFEFLNIHSFVAIAADTDGIDGTEDNAGAIIDQNTLSKIRNKNVSSPSCVTKTFRVLKKNTRLLGGCFSLQSK